MTTAFVSNDDIVVNTANTQFNINATSGITTPSCGIYVNATTSSTSNVIAFNNGEMINISTCASVGAIRSTTSTNIISVNGTGTTYYVTGTSGIIQSACPPDEGAVRLWKANAKRNARKRVKNIHRAKGAIKRALKLIDNIGFGKEVSVFLGGNSIEVSHPDSLFKFVITKRANSLIERTMHPGFSTPYSLSLYLKSDVHISDLCVYMKDTPVLDQVLAVAMFIRSGDERDILTKANWFSKTQDMETREILALEYPYLKDKLGVRYAEENEPQILDGRITIASNDYDVTCPVRTDFFNAEIACNTL